MKKIIFSIIALFAISISVTSAQSMKKMASHDAPKKVQLVQTDGAFTATSLELTAGTYVFDISNDGVDHEVGFVLAPKGKPEPEHHIKTAYVQSTVKNGATQSSQAVTLAKGEYIYFCPLNPTPQYTLIVK